MLPTSMTTNGQIGGLGGLGGVVGLPIDSRSLNFDYHLSYTTSGAPLQPHHLQSSQSSSSSRAHGGIGGPIPSAECSVLTVDSNSKSNDITVVERTMLTTSTTLANQPLSSSGGHLNTAGGASRLQTSMGSGSSAYHSGSSNQMSASSSANPIRSSVSSAKASPWATGGGGDCVDSAPLSLSNSAHMPTSTPDLAFMRKLLATRARTTPISAKSSFSQSSISQFQGKMT